jgi:hypothetical protein
MHAVRGCKRERALPWIVDICQEVVGKCPILAGWIKLRNCEEKSFFREELAIDSVRPR